MQPPWSGRIATGTTHQVVERVAESKGNLVIDASVAIGLVRKEDTSEQGSAIVRRHQRAGGRLLAPSVLWLEVLNSLGRRHRLPAAAILEDLAELDALGLETIELDRPMLLLVLDAVARHGLTAYDAAYLVLAETMDAQLLTADAILARAAGERAILLGGAGVEREISEAPAAYRLPDWTSWPGSAAYLRQLRADASR